MRKGKMHFSSEHEVESCSLVNPLEVIYCRRDQQEVGTIAAGDGGNELVWFKGVALGDSRQGVICLLKQCFNYSSVVLVVIIKCSPRSGVNTTS